MAIRVDMEKSNKGTDRGWYMIGTAVHEDGKHIRLDMYESSDDATVTAAFGNIPLDELLAALRQIDGVTAEYTPPPVLRAADYPVGTLIEWQRFGNPAWERVFKVSDDNWVISTAVMPVSNWYVQDEAESADAVRVLFGNKNKED